MRLAQGQTAFHSIYKHLFLHMNFRISFSSSMTTPIGIFIGTSLNFVDDVTIFSLANPEHDMGLLSILRSSYMSFNKVL